MNYLSLVAFASEAPVILPGNNPTGLGFPAILMGVISFGLVFGGLAVCIWIAMKDTKQDQSKITESK
ncbi:MAG: MetS family NSS transporter small subunit [Planctomycetes bacterium]|nr:MetS family NSS transporter small subunit [Planctomycetota bacterium]